ncbi:hypothetical protein ACN9MU_16605 [Pseudoduganella sp. R-32]|uniref:hypothetical protein n=1 Tax=Pseudoduganella sp. R-32 TaxID=3404061 RepID=UPI003CF89B6B
MSYSLIAQATIEGEHRADAAMVQVLAKIAGQDCVYQALLPLLPEACTDETHASVRGFCRVLQKRIERGVL